MEEEAAILKDLTDEEKAKYEEMHEVLINELVELVRLTDLSSEIRQHMFKWMPGIPENYTARASKAVKQRRTPDEKGNVTVAIPTAETEEQTEGEHEEAEDTDEEEEIEVNKDETVNQAEVKATLKKLEDGFKLKATGYEQLTKAIPQLSDKEIVQASLKVTAELEGHFSMPVQDFLEK